MSQVKNTTKEVKWKQLSEVDRYKIEAYYETGMKPLEIGKMLKPPRDRRTIERELKRGMVEQRHLNPSSRKSIEEPLYIVEKVYKADVAQRVHEERGANKGVALKIGHDHELANYIEKKIKKEKWSPDVIIGRIKEEKLDFKTSICTKTLYNYIDKGIFAEISNKDLWVKKTGVKRSYKKVGKVALTNKRGKSIEERPKEIEERKEKGHWEIDLVVGKRGTKPVILTLVERKTRKSLYILVKNKTQKEVVAAIKRARRRVGGNFKDVFKTITADNGTEFLDSEAIKKAGKCEEIYYAHPYSSYERGSNENGNKMLRRFIPKGTNIGVITVKQLQQIEDWVNNYPRKRLNYKTANEVAA